MSRLIKNIYVGVDVNLIFVNVVAISSVTHPWSSFCEASLGNNNCPCLTLENAPPLTQNDESFATDTLGVDITEYGLGGCRNMIEKHTIVPIRTALALLGVLASGAGSTR